MNKLVDLEHAITSRVVPGKEWIAARLDISRYELLMKKEQEDHSTYNDDLLEIYRLISDNLASALVSPNLYVREWGKYINEKKKEI